MWMYFVSCAAHKQKVPALSFYSNILFEIAELQWYGETRTGLKAAVIQTNQFIPSTVDKAISPQLLPTLPPLPPLPPPATSLVKTSYHDFFFLFFSKPEQENVNHLRFSRGKLTEGTKAFIIFEKNLEINIILRWLTEVSKHLVATRPTPPFSKAPILSHSSMHRNFSL